MFSSMTRLFLVLMLGLALFSPEPVQANAEPHHAEETGHEVKLPMDWKTDLALFSLVTFVVYVAALRFGAWGPLQAGLNERERQIRQNIADAESNRLKSETMLKDYEVKLSKVQEEVRDIMAEARRDADHTKHEIIETAQREADATKHRAIAEIERSRDQALTELFDFVSNNVVNATEKMIGRSLSGSDQDRLVQEALAELNVRRN